MNTNEKLAVLRNNMSKQGVSALVVPSSDAHMSESLPEHAKARKYYSGFGGSAGTLVVTQTQSGLWTDGRYFVAAARDLSRSEIELYRMGEKGVPTVCEFLAEKLAPNETLGIDGEVASVESYQQYVKALSGKSVEIKSVKCAVDCWENRPEMPATPVFLHDVKYAGETAKTKLDNLRTALKAKGATSCVISQLPCVAWLLNIRASDIKSNPFALGYCHVSESSATLFINQARLPEDVRASLLENGVGVESYESILPFIEKIASTETFLVDPVGTSFDIYNAILNNPKLSAIFGDEPVLLQKAVKNDVEIANIKNAHVKDGCAMVRFQIRLENMLKAKQRVTELDICDILIEERMKEDLCIGESFSTIAAYGANAAMMHYGPTAESFAVLKPEGYLLVDSGAQYLDGTTDITRTYALGSPTQTEKELYTYVLKSNIDLELAVFMEGCSGANLDIIARSAVWAHGIDYRCGTGHGVGFFGAIHEGPHSMRTTNNVPIVPGMLVTDEPGIYEENIIGIRIETELLCKQVLETKYGKFYGFECVTYCPIDTTPVIASLLNADELSWLNDYHENVYKTLAPHLNAEEKVWLKKKTEPVGAAV